MINETTMATAGFVLGIVGFVLGLIGVYLGVKAR